MRHLAGQKFGMLVVFERVPLGNGTGWLCNCDCGKTWTGPTSRLTSGNTESCGCRRGGASHGHVRGNVKSKTYGSWAAMLSRCYQPSNPAFAHYQKLGITVCSRWRTGEGGKGAFECFLADMGERPSKEMTIDREDNDGHYGPDNCRWATRQEQANNRRTNKLFEYQGRTVTFADLVRETGMDKEFLRHRLLRAGWTLEEALAAPKQQGRRKGTERPRLS